MKRIELEALEDFQCIGGDCPQLCCKSFYINIDDITRQKWADLDDINGQGKMSQYIVEKDIDGQKNYLMQLNENNDCVLLDDKGWCKVHSKLGHEVLPDICRNYPRFGMHNSMSELKTGTMSCPVLCKTVLFEADDLSFNFKLDALFKLDVSDSANSVDELRGYIAEFISKIFQVKKVPLNVKLFYIGHCIGVANQLLLSKKYSRADFQELFSAPKDALMMINKDLNNKKIKPDPVTAGSFWKSIAAIFMSRNIRLDCVDIDQSPFMKLCAEDKSDFDYFREIYNQILEYKTHWQKNRDDELLAVCERYIITSFINKGFPLHPQDEQFSATLVFVMTAACAIQLGLWIAFKEGGTPTSEQLQQIFYHIENKIGHTDTIYKTLAEDPHMMQIERYAQVFLDLFV